MSPIDNTSLSGDTYHNRYSGDSPYKGNKKFKKLPRKCEKCGSTKNLDIHHRSGNHNNKSRSDLIVLCRSCHRKLHDGMGEEIISSAARIIADPNSPESQAIAKKHKNSDILHVEFILCHVGQNKNKDIFESEDLQSSASTIIHKPINWEHSARNIGVVYESKYISVKDPDETIKSAYASLDPFENDFVVCKGAIWEYKHPAEARIIRQRHIANELKFSMENRFEIAKCTVCGEKFDNPFNYCDHLLTRRDSDAGRIFENSNFVGVAVVKFPADKNAGSLAIAASYPNYLLIDSLSIKDYKKFVITSKENLMKRKTIPSEYIIELDEIPDEGFADDVNRVFPIDNKEHISESASKLLNNELEFYNKEETIYVLNRLGIAAHNEDVNLEDFKIEDKSRGGLNMEKEEFEKAVATEVEKRLKEAEKTGEVTQLNSKIEELKKNLASASELVKDKEDAYAKIEKEFKDFKDTIEKEKVVVARIESLEKDGLVFKENIDTIKTSVKDMTEEAFANFVKVLQEARGKKLTPEELKKIEEEKKLAAEKAKKENKTKSNIVNESKASIVINSPDDNKEDDPFTIIDTILAKK